MHDCGIFSILLTAMMQFLLTGPSCSKVEWCYPTDTEIVFHGINEISAEHYLTFGGHVVYLWLD